MHRGPRADIEKLVRPELRKYLPEECFTDNNGKKPTATSTTISNVKKE